MAFVPKSSFVMYPSHICLDINRDHPLVIYTSHHFHNLARPLSVHFVFSESTLVHSAFSKCNGSTPLSHSVFKHALVLLPVREHGVSTAIKKVMVPVSIVIKPISKGQHSSTMSVVFLPLSIVLGPVCPVQYTLHALHIL